LHLTEPWRIVIAGRPNVGKSTLLNALVGFERAIADASPGTTRDVVTASAAIGGWPVEFADTAGLRPTGDVVERLGVERTQLQLQSADVALLVRDALAPEIGEAAPVHAGKRIVVYNKCDLLSLDSERKLQRRNDGLLVSALTGKGASELILALEKTIVPLPPARGAAVPFTRRHVAAIEQALAAIDRGQREAARESLTQIQT
jgi:tRNA modification GTPase